MKNDAIYKRLETMAKRGRTSSHNLRLWRSQISKLEKEGFTVIKLKPTGRLQEWDCVISWKNPKSKDGLAAEMLKISLDTLSNNLK